MEKLNKITTELYLAEVASFKPLTLDIFELFLKTIAPSDLEYKAGQCINLQIAGHDKLTPIASLPLELSNSLTVCLSIEGNEEIKTFCDTLTKNMQVKYSGPVGGFGYANLAKPILMVARGVGIVPFASLVPHLLINHPNVNIKLLFEVDSEDDVFYFGKFHKLAERYVNFKFLPMLVHPHSMWPGEVGTVSTYMDIASSFYADSEVFCCGKPDFVTLIKQKLFKMGFKPEQINCQEL